MATIKVKQIKSRIGAPVDQKRTLLSLGLRKISQVVEVFQEETGTGHIRRWLCFFALNMMLANPAQAVNGASSINTAGNAPTVR